jgi:hypothetical protein
MLNKDPVVNANDIRGNPIRKGAETPESPVHDHALSLSYDRSRFVLERRRKTPDEVEQTLRPAAI